MKYLLVLITIARFRESCAKICLLRVQREINREKFKWTIAFCQQGSAETVRDEVGARYSLSRQLTLPLQQEVSTSPTLSSIKTST